MYVLNDGLKNTNNKAMWNNSYTWHNSSLQIIFLLPAIVANLCTMYNNNEIKMAMSFGNGDGKGKCMQPNNQLSIILFKFISFF